MSTFSTYSSVHICLQNVNTNMEYVSINVHKQCVAMWYWREAEMGTVKLFIVNRNTSYKTVNCIWYMLNYSFTEDQRIT